MSGRCRVRISKIRSVHKHRFVADSIIGASAQYK
jgi:hypothetical protein